MVRGVREFSTNIYLYSLFTQMCNILHTDLVYRRFTESLNLHDTNSKSLIFLAYLYDFTNMYSVTALAAARMVQSTVSPYNEFVFFYFILKCNFK